MHVWTKKRFGGASRVASKRRPVEKGVGLRQRHQQLLQVAAGLREAALHLIEPAAVRLVFEPAHGVAVPLRGHAVADARALRKSQRELLGAVERSVELRIAR